MENLTWKIDNEKISIEIARWIIETINHVKFKEAINLIKPGVYHTFYEETRIKLSLHDSGYVVITDDRANVVHWGMFHILCDKLKDLYPSLRSL